MHTPAPSRFDRTAVAVTTSLLCSLMQSVHAQSVEPAATAASSRTPAETNVLERIVVTANKREQAAIDVAASISSIRGERLALAGAARLEDFAAQVPGLSVISVTRGQSAVVLRGISTGANQSTPTTAQYIDEAPIGSVNAFASGSVLTPDLDPAELQRIEVLKGPQGTLYGAGAVGGLVRYVTAPANTGSFSGVVTLGMNSIAGGSSGSNERVALNLPLEKDVLGLRFSAFNRVEGGYIDNPANGAQDVNRATTRGGRIAMDWKVAPQWLVRGWVLSQKFKAKGYGNEDAVAPDLVPLSGDLQRSTWIDEPQESSLDVSNVTVKGRVGNFELVSATTWQDSRMHFKQDVSRPNTALLQLIFGLPGLGAQSDVDIRTRRISQELRARSSAFEERLEYDAGLFWTDEKSSNAIGADSPFFMATGQVLPTPKLADALTKSKYRELSAFGNVTLAVTPDVDLMAGLRLSTDRQHYDQNYAPTIASPLASVVIQDVAQRHSTWMLGARYKPFVDTALYARAASAYRPGGPSTLPAGLVPDGKPSFDADKLVSYEVGFKSYFLGGKASIESALFFTDWQKLQILTTAPSSTISYAYFVNGGTARSQGAELSLIYTPAAGLTLRANGAYTDARLTSDAPAAGGVNGDSMPFTPKWSGSVGGQYDFVIASRKAWAGISVNYMGTRRSDFSLRKAVEVPAYTTWNFNAGVDIDSLRLSAYVRNLSNKRGLNHAAPGGDQVTGLNPSGNPFVAGVIQPRTVGIDMAYRF